MCPDCEKQVSELRSAPRRPGKSRVHRPALDAVQVHRIRTVIERSVVVALGAATSAEHLSAVTVHTLERPVRGGAASVRARQLAMYLGHVGCGLTLTQAARLYGRDRTTAAHACTVIEDRRDDPAFDRVIELLERCVRLSFHQIEPALADRLAQH